MALGETLRTAREARGLTTAQVAEGTRMMVQMVEEIEREDFRRIAAPIYGKGFIRLFAEYVGVEPDPLIREYLERHVRPKAFGLSGPSPDAAKPAPPPAPPAAPKRKRFDPTIDMETASSAQADSPERRGTATEALDDDPSPDAFALHGDALDVEPDLFAKPPKAAPAFHPSIDSMLQGARDRLRSLKRSVQPVVARGVNTVSALPRQWLWGGAAIGLAIVLAVAGLLRLASSLRPDDETVGPPPTPEFARIIPPPPPYFD